MMRRCTLGLALSGGLVAMGLAQPAAAEVSIVNGRALLAANCGRCHAVGGSGDSANTQAPPFRVVLRRYPAADLEESLAEGIVTGHPDMPVFELDPAAIADVVGYLDALAVVTSGD